MATEPLPPEEMTVRMRFDSDEPRPGSGGDVSLWVGDRKVGDGRIDRTVPIAFSSYAGMDVGRDNGLVVDRAYHVKAPYAFTGTVRKVAFDLKPMKLEDEKSLHSAVHEHGVGAGAGA